MKIVEWSDEDGAFVGRCPGVIGPCCHGQAEDEVEVYRELCEIVSEWLGIAVPARHGAPLSPADRRNWYHGTGRRVRSSSMLRYKAGYKYVATGVGASVGLPRRDHLRRGPRRRAQPLAVALVDVAEAAVESGQPLPIPDPSATDPEMDIEEPIYLHLLAS